MTTWIGTEHFISRARLYRYYRSQEYDMIAIEQKLKEGLCKIGRPDVKLGDLTFVNDEGRYCIEFDAEVKMRGVSLRFADQRYNYSTSINGTRKSICAYFNTMLNVAPMGASYDVMMKPKMITFLDEDKHRTFFFPE